MLDELLSEMDVLEVDGNVYRVMELLDDEVRLSVPGDDPDIYKSRSEVQNWLIESNRVCIIR